MVMLWILISPAMEGFDRVGKTVPSFKRSVGASLTRLNGSRLNYRSLSEYSHLLLI